MPEPMVRQPADVGGRLAERFHATRALSTALVEPLSESDATLQSMEDASPAKWHLAHTTWFWETFLLRDRLPGYRPFEADWAYLFNSYYEAEGARIARASRGMLSRPSLEQIAGWRAHVDEAMAPLLEDPACAALIALGVAHEQQHQELLLTDIKHALFQNPLGPAMWTLRDARTASSLLRTKGQGDLSLPVRPEEGSVAKRCRRQNPKAESPSRRTGEWHAHPGGIAMVGHEGGSFAFDNEGPRHRVLLEPFALAGPLVTNGEWAQFVADGGYRTAALWLSDGWAWVNENGISAPLYWRGDEQFTHWGWQARDPEVPVTHISYYEADAFAAWAGLRLPTECEWEAIAQAHDPAGGNQLDGAAPPLPRGGADLFGDGWQFTRSAYLPYPRFRPAAGAVGEYNGKFMAGQFVLKGASCATVRGHSRASYRNFFYPHQRWQFTGLRLAKDL